MRKINEIIDEKKAHFEKNDTTQHSVVLSDLSPSSADTHTLTNTRKSHKSYLEKICFQYGGFFKFVLYGTLKEVYTP